ncbi:MAG: hypothetical protein MZV64_60380 [Ignavibacteriales bacterium]|nr:hypothetical protein [Ignavibacteriales bacterium]
MTSFSLYPPLMRRAASRASVDGSQETYAIRLGPSFRIPSTTALSRPARGGSTRTMSGFASRCGITASASSS